MGSCLISRVVLCVGCIDERKSFKGFKFSRCWSQYRFSIGRRDSFTPLYRFLFSLSVFVSLLVIHSSVFSFYLTVSFGLFLLHSLIFTYCTFAEGNQYWSGVDNLLRQQGNETSSLTINSPYAVSWIKIYLQCWFHLRFCRYVCTCLNQWSSFLSSHPFPPQNQVLCFKVKPQNKWWNSHGRQSCKWNFWLNKSENIFSIQSSFDCICLFSHGRKRKTTKQDNYHMKLCSS